MVAAQEKYDEICAFRANNPDFMIIARSWHNKPLAEMSPREISYKHYLELVLGFIETYVYLCRVEHVITEDRFNQFIKPMMLLEVSYSQNAFAILQNAQSISTFARDYISTILSDLQLYYNGIEDINFAV